MSLFSDILCEELTLLSESMVSTDMVTKAMDNRQRVIITYHTNGEDNNTGPRLIEIYAYGVTKAGNPVIRAFQPYGDTTTSIPNWKFFLLSRISSWKETGQTYEKLPEEQYPGVGDFNPNGDKTMAVVYKIVSMNGNTTTEIPNNTMPTGPKTSAEMSKGGEVFKTDTEKRMQSLQNQLNKPIMLKDLLGDKETPQTIDKGKTTPTPQTQDTPEQPSQPVTMSASDVAKKLQKGEDLFKTDTERGMDRLRQQLANPRKIDLSQIPKR